MSQRLVASFVVIAGTCGVVTVLLAVLAISSTLMRAIEGSGDPMRVIVLSHSATAESSSSLSREALRHIGSAQGVKVLDGRPAVSGEALFAVPVRDRKTGKRAQIVVRATTTPLEHFRSAIELLEGRVPWSGTRELLVGSAASEKYRGLDVGDEISIRGSRWRIVGRFDSGGSSHESELLAEAETMLAALQLNHFNAAHVRLDSESAYARLEEALTSNPALSIRIVREQEYARMQSEPIAAAWHFVAYIASGIMALGAMFGAANTMYSSVSSRAREIATLRAIGFNAVSVVGAVLLEAIVLAVAGALLGSTLVWLILDGEIVSTRLGAGNVVARLSLDPLLVLLGIAWSCGIGLVGGLFPAVRAARLPIAAALREP